MQLEVTKLFNVCWLQCQQIYFTQQINYNISVKFDWTQIGRHQVYSQQCDVRFICTCYNKLRQRHRTLFAGRLSSLISAQVKKYIPNTKWSLEKGIHYIKRFNKSVKALLWIIVKLVSLTLIIILLKNGSSNRFNNSTRKFNVRWDTLSSNTIGNVHHVEITV